MRGHRGARARTIGSVLDDTLPARWYSDPDIFQRERRAIFASEWQALGPAAHVERPGSYLLGGVAGWDEAGLALLHRLVRQAVKMDP